MSSARYEHPQGKGAAPLSGHYVGLACALQLGDNMDCLVRGTCMLPIIGDGQCVTVRKQARYWPGDIVLFTDVQGRPLVHRYLGSAPNGRCITKADVALNIDILVHASQILGKAICCEGQALQIPASQRFRAVLHHQAWLFKLGIRHFVRTLRGKAL